MIAAREKEIREALFRAQSGRRPGLKFEVVVAELLEEIELLRENKGKEVVESPSARAARLYAEGVAERALRRQRALHRERLGCCGELVEDGHHAVCSKRPQGEPVEVHADQVSLI